MSAPKLGYLCLSENPTREAGRALIRQFVLVREAERMGYDDIWLAEHHFDEVWPQSAILALLGQLVAVTSKSRIGSLVLMPGQHDPLMLAEHVATLDLFSKGRICRMVDTYLRASGGRAPELTLARFASTAATTAEAIDTAVPYFETLARHASEAGWGQDPQACMVRDPQALLTESLVGNHAEVAAQFKGMAGRLGATRIAIVPTSAQFDTHKHILADFVDEVRPLLDED